MPIRKKDEKCSKSFSQVKYPLYTTVEKLNPFKNLAFKADVIPPSFIAYCLGHFGMPKN